MVRIRTKIKTKRCYRNRKFPAAVRHVLTNNDNEIRCLLACLTACTHTNVVFPRALNSSFDRLGGLVVKASASRAQDPGFESHLRRDFSGSSHTSDFEIGTLVATLLDAWRYRVSAGTGRHSVSIL